MSQPHAAHFASAEEQAHAVALGTWLFLAGEVLVFGALFLAVTVARLDDPASFVSASGHLYRGLASANTAVLLTSSLLVALAARAARGPRPGAARPWLLAAAALGVCFLAIKGVEYGLDAQDGLLPGPGFDAEAFARPRAAQRFFWLYLVLTGVHAVHVLVGVALLSLAAWAPAPQRVEGVGLFWHFVDLVWIYLLPALYLA